MRITKEFNSFLLMILQISLVYAQNTHFRLKHNPIHFQIQYTILLEIVYRFVCLKPILTNFTTTHIHVLKSLLICFLNITTYPILTSGYSFLYMAVLNFNAINTSIQTTLTQSFSDHAPSFQLQNLNGHQTFDNSSFTTPSLYSRYSRCY